MSVQQGSPKTISGEKEESAPITMRAMRERFGFLTRAFCERFFSPIRFSPAQENLLQERAREGLIVYVMQSAGILNYLFLNFWCLQLKLPLSSYGNGIPVFFCFQPLKAILSAVNRKIRAVFRKGKAPAPESFPAFCERSLANGKSLVLFLGHSRLFRQRTYVEPREMIDTLLTLQAKQAASVFLVPIGILWGRRPEKVQRTIIDILLGEKETPGIIRQLLMLMRYGPLSVATMGEIIDLKEFQRTNAHVEEELLQKKVRWALHRELTLAKKQIAGPRLKPRRHILQSILSSRTLREQAREIARSEGKSFDQVMKQAAKIVNEIAADFNSTYIAFLDWLLTWVWNNIYNGLIVDKKGIERLKVASRKGSMILLPSHKSHIDYLVLSYAFYHHGLPPPHIAAGVNLSFWPLGHIFRRAGAFFIRRTFQGQPLYTAVFSTYIKRLLREGYVQEFFLEGTRSRTGKLLYPKLGMLSMEIDAFSEGVSDDLFLVPVSINYEKVVEETSYTQESAGAKKRKERFWDLLKTPKFLRRKYGRVYIQIAQPLSVREYLQEKKTDMVKLGSEGRRRVTEDLAFRTCYAINEVTTVTPAALVATVLLNHPKRGIAQPELLKRTSFLFQLLQERKARTSLSLQNLRWALDEALDVFVADKVIQRWEDPEGTIFTLDESRRAPLNYYKNNILHYFLPVSLVASVFRMFRIDRLPEAGLLDGIGFLMGVFQREFIFPPVEPTRQIWEMTGELLLDRRGSLARDGQGMILNQDPPSLDYLSELLLNFFESYYLVFHAAAQFLESGEVEEKDFFKNLLEGADRLYRRGDLQRIESKSIFVFRNAISSLVMSGCLHRSTDKGGTKLSVHPGKMEEILSHRERFARLLSHQRVTES